MKNQYKTFALVATSLALLFAIAMSVMNLADSWSQYDLSDHEYLLDLCFWSIAFAYIFAHLSHKDGDLEVGRIRKKPIRLKQLFLGNALLFGLTACFGVNSPYEWVQVLHFIFTIASIAMGYVTLWVYTLTPFYLDFKKIEVFKERAWGVFFTIIGIGGLCLGFFTDVISTAWGEVIAAVPLALFMYFTLE